MKSFTVSVNNWVMIVDKVHLIMNLKHYFLLKLLWKWLLILDSKFEVYQSCDKFVKEEIIYIMFYWDTLNKNKLAYQSI